MKTQVYFYKFDTKIKPGCIVAEGVRFETLEIVGENFDETTFNLLCEDHPELKKVDLKSFKTAVQTNFPNF